MSELSRKQKEVIDLIKSGAKLKTNEGENWKAWLVIVDKKTYINRQTATALFNKGVIKPVADKFNLNGVFTYGLK